MTSPLRRFTVSRVIYGETNMQISNNLRAAVRLLEAVADENRVRILKCLQVRPACVCELVQALDMPQPRASRHLKTLREAGLVEDTRDAQWVEYALVKAEDGSPESELLALVAGWLEDDPAVGEDRRRYAQASRDLCVGKSAEECLEMLRGGVGVER